MRLTSRLRLSECVTFIHRRLWPAIVRLSSVVPKQDLAALREERTRTGAHRLVSTPFPRWVPDATRITARGMPLEDAHSQFGPLLSILRAGRRLSRYDLRAFSLFFELLMFHRAAVRLMAVTALGLWLLLPYVTCGAGELERQRAQTLVDTAVKLTDSKQAVKLEATEMDPSFEQSYVYLGLFYQSREQFSEEARVYKKLAKNRFWAAAYSNVAEADLGLTPPNYDEALEYFKRAYAMDRHSSRVAFRIGQILAIKGDRDEATRFLKQASEDTKDTETASEARKALQQIGAF